jgi:hypothetical protein
MIAIGSLGRRAVGEAGRARVLMSMAPATVFLPNSVPSGPRNNWMLSTSIRSVMTRPARGR